MFGKAAKSGPVALGFGWSPMFFNKFPCKRLSRAFCTVGSFNNGDGATVLDVTTDGLPGTFVETAKRQKKLFLNIVRRVKIK